MRSHYSRWFYSRRSCRRCADSRRRRYRYKTPSYEDILGYQAYNANDLGDLDLQGIFPILVAGCIMLTPILNWSTQIREHARAIAVCWGLLMFTALVPTLQRIWKGVVPFIDWDQLVTCDVDTTKNCTLDFVSPDSNAISSTFYDK